MGRYFPNRDECLQGLTCSSCLQSTSYYRRENEGVNLCKGCFKDSVERKVRRTISRWKMFSPADHIAVAVSGGKDSLTMLMILKKLSAKFKQTRITAVTVDEGIAGYREEAIDLAKAYCNKLEDDQEIVSFKELYGDGLDDFLRGKPERMTACSYCGVFRRKAINIGAQRVGVANSGTGQNLGYVLESDVVSLF